MTDESARFALPLLQPGQAQKELFHNEALTRLDIALHAVAATLSTDLPPTSPSPGACWIVGSAPSGAFSGHAGQVAGWTSGGWRFVAPKAGTLVWIADAGRWAWYDGSAWRDDGLPVAALIIAGEQVVGPRQPAIADISGGINADPETRAAVSSILATLRVHGIIDT